MHQHWQGAWSLSPCCQHLLLDWDTSWKAVVGVWAVGDSAGWPMATDSWLQPLPALSWVSSALVLLNSSSIPWEVQWRQSTAGYRRYQQSQHFCSVVVLTKVPWTTYFRMFPRTGCIFIPGLEKENGEAPWSADSCPPLKPTSEWTELNLFPFPHSR